MLFWSIKKKTYSKAKLPKNEQFFWKKKRSSQQTKSLISMLMELARVNDVNTVMYSIDPTQFISFPRIW